MSSHCESLSDFERKLYHRNILLNEIGEAGQVKLLESSVLVIGLGGLGSPALFYLASSGIGEIGLADPDRVVLSNLQRQILHGHQDIGKEKTLSAKESIDKLRKDIQLYVYPETVSHSNADRIISRYDFIIDATDNFKSKFLINDMCVKMGKAFSHAGINGFFGQTMTVVPGEGPCLRCVFQHVANEEKLSDANPAGILATVAGVFGAIQATEAIKYILGKGDLLLGRILTFDALSMHFHEIILPSDLQCNVCSDVERKGVIDE